MKKPLTKKELVKNVLNDDFKNTTTLPYTLTEFQNYLLEKHHINIDYSYLRETLNQLNIQHKKRKYSRRKIRTASHTDRMTMFSHSDKTDYLNVVYLAVQNYFKTIEPHDAGIKIFIQDDLANFVKNTIGVKPSPHIIKNTVVKLNAHHENIMQKKEYNKRNMFVAISRYFNEKSPNKDGIKTYTLTGIVKCLRENLGINPPTVTIKKIIKALNIKDIEHSAQQSHVEKTKIAVATYFKDLKPNDKGIKEYTLNNLACYSHSKNKPFVVC